MGSFDPSVCLSMNRTPKLQKGGPTTDMKKEWIELLSLKVKPVFAGGRSAVIVAMVARRAFASVYYSHISSRNDFWFYYVD